MKEEANPPTLDRAAPADRTAHGPRSVFILAGILLLAGCLEMLFLGEQSFSLDEAYRVILARLEWPAFWWFLCHREANMSLYCFLLRIWLSVGDSEALIRALSVMPALATVLAVYVLGKHLFGLRLGLIGAFLLACNAFHVHYAQDARGYSLLVFLVVLSSLFFLKGIEQPSGRNWIVYILTSVLALYTHFFAALVLAAHAVSLLGLPRRFIPWRKLVLSTLLIGFLALPLLFFVFTRDVGQIAWLSRPGVRDIPGFFSALAGGGGNLLLAAYLLSCLLAFVKAGKRGFGSGPHFDAWHFQFVVAWLFVPVILALGISLAKPVFLDRYLIVCLPPFVLLAALGISQIQRRWVLGVALAVLAILALRGDYFNYERMGRYQRFDVENWRDATRFLLSEAKPRDAVLFYHAYGVLPFEYYRSRFQGSTEKPEVVFRPGRALLSDVNIDPIPDAGFVENLPAHYDRVWLVLYPDNDIVARTPLRLSLAAHYHLVDARRFPGVGMLLFGKRAGHEGQ
jgi:4-amino-4-deoxy-L-arabinose transferase-like glycosyltransferase